MITVSEAIIVEGKYDKNTLSQVVDAVIIDTSGFGIFNDGEKVSLLRRLAEKTGIVVFTDSDGAGFVIRNFIKGAVQTGRVLHAYIPDIAGKEKRKRAPSREGKLGVEGMTPEVIEKALRQSGATVDGQRGSPKQYLKKSDLYAMGLSGGANSREKRAQLLKKLELPEHMSSGVLLDVVNALYTRQEFEEIVEELDI